jgi:hypothetical protein
LTIFIKRKLCLFIDRIVCIFYTNNFGSSLFVPLIYNSWNSWPSLLKPSIVCKGLMSYLCLRIVVSNTYCVLFLFCFSSSCCQFLWIVHFWLPLRCYLTFISGHTIHNINVQIMYRRTRCILSTVWLSLFQPKNRHKFA